MAHLLLNYTINLLRWEIWTVGVFLKNVKKLPMYSVMSGRRLNDYIRAYSDIRHCDF
jgi:hypothetical protein